MSTFVVGIILSVLGGLTLVLLGVLGWVGSGMNENLKNIAGSVSKIEKDLGILGNDHGNLKGQVNNIDRRVSALENE